LLRRAGRRAGHLPAGPGEARRAGRALRHRARPRGGPRDLRALRAALRLGRERLRQPEAPEDQLEALRVDREVDPAVELLVALELGGADDERGDVLDLVAAKR